jgi:DNA-binding NtrC family response regulator
MTKNHNLGKKIIIVEDEEPLRILYEKRLKRKGFYVRSHPRAEPALKQLEKETFHVALVDIRMPGMSGIEFLKIAKKEYTDLEIIMLTAFGSIESAVEAMKLGAYDYLTKPCHLPELEILVAKAYEKCSLLQQNTRLKEELRSKENYDSLIYSSSPMKKLMRDVEKVAQSDSPVVIEGDSGTGKELVANTIHKISPRKNGSFVAINCANLQENLVENELFGHEKGAYTGAVHAKRGLIELAHQGTLFIDEVGEMHPSAQAKLLRVLETNKFRRVGGNKEHISDARVIAATNENLSEAVAKKKFRNDLYFRLNVINFYLPCLKDRKQDIPLLIQYFLKKKNMILKASKTISPEAEQLFFNYSWPGNVRELANVIERAIILSMGDIIQPQDLPFCNMPQSRPDLGSLKEMEQTHIQHVLHSTNGNKTQAAKVLGISVRNLYRKMEQYQTQLGRANDSTSQLNF